MNSILFHNGQWSMYYGAADTVIGLATAPLRPAPRRPSPRTGFENGDRYPDWADVADTGGGQSGGISNVVGYPGYGLAGPEAGMRQETAHSGSTALMYSGASTGAADGLRVHAAVRHLRASADRGREHDAVVLDLSAELDEQHLRGAGHRVQRRHRRCGTSGRPTRTATGCIRRASAGT